MRTAQHQFQVSPRRRGRSSSPGSHLTGMYFAQTVVLEVNVQVRGLNSQWKESPKAQLTSDSLLVQPLPVLPLSTLNKLKLNHHKASKNVGIKVQSEDLTILLRADKITATKLWTKIIWTKLATMNCFCNPDQHFEERLEGCLLKKGQFLGSWEERWVSIRVKQGLKSGKGQQGHKSLSISGVSQLWTRFQLIKGRTYLVVKLWYGLVKEQFAVPVDQAVVWIEAFHSLLGK